MSDEQCELFLILANQDDVDVLYDGVAYADAETAIAAAGAHIFEAQQTGWTGVGLTKTVTRDPDGRGAEVCIRYTIPAQGDREFVHCYEIRRFAIASP